jgi:hypothetical protein
MLVSMTAAGWHELFEAYLHERLQGGAIKGLALERGHIARHDSLIFLPIGNLISLVGWCGRKALGGINTAGRGTKNGPAGTQ